MQERNRFLDGVERLGNALPDPALIFVGLIAVLMATSAVGAVAGWSALNPVTGETLSVKSLLSEQSLQLLIIGTPRTYAAFAPLGLVLTVMLGAGVADRSGLFDALVRASLSAVPERALVPAHGKPPPGSGAVCKPLDGARPVGRHPEQIPWATLPTVQTRPAGRQVSRPDAGLWPYQT